MSLIKSSTRSWNGEGVIRWAQSNLDAIQRQRLEDEQLVIFRGEDE